MIKKITLLIAILSVFMLSAGKLSAQNENILQHNIHFYSYDQDMWGAGGAFSLDLDYPLIDLLFQEDISEGVYVDIPFLGTVGAGFELGFWAYLSSTFSIHGFTLGSIDIDYPVEITLDFPDHYSFDHGETITIETWYEVLDGWRLETHFPTLGVISLDLEYGFGVYANIIVCVFGCETIPLLPTLSVPLNPPYNDPVPHDSIAIFYINGETGEVAYPCINETTGLPQICEDDFLPIIIGDFLGIGLTGEIDIPYVETEDWLDPETQCLHAYGQDEWISFNWNLMEFLSFLAGLIPPPEGPAIAQIIDILNGGTIELEILPGVSAILDYYLLHLSLHMSSYMTQHFTFCAAIWVTLGFPIELPYFVTDPENTTVDEGIAQDITFQVNNDLHITYPCYDWDSMPVDVAYHFDNVFNNHTYDSMAFDFIIQVFYVHILIPFSFPIAPDYIPPFDLPEVNVVNTDLGISQNLQYSSPPIYPDEILLGEYLPQEGEIFSTSNQTNVSNQIVTSNTKGKPEPDDNQTKDIEFEIGPLIDESIPLFDFLITWYDEDWEMEGFLLDTVVEGTWLYPLPELDMQIDAQDVLCFGDTTGVVTVTALNSTGPYTFTYSWTSENTHMSPVDSVIVPSGYYYVTVTDVYGCSVEGEINIADAFPPLVSYLHADDVLCAGEPTGNLYSYVSGGAPPYSYLWEPSGSTDPNPQGVYAGWHYLTITDSVGCTHLDSVFIDEPDEPLNIESEYGNVTCYGYSDGYIDITVTGGTPPYFYNWSNGQQTQDLINLTDGAYSVTVIDSHDCIIEEDFVIIMPPELTVDIEVVDILCYGDNTGIVNAIVEGGTPPYTYLWSNDATTQDLLNVYAGIYAVTVTDANGCEAFAVDEVEEPDLPLTAYIEPTDVRCFGEGNGIADLIVFGGTPPYYYSWSNGEISEDIYDLTPGLYSVTIFDSHDCVAYAETHIYQAEAPMSGTITGNDVTCNGGSDGNVMIDIHGGVPPYHYTWSNGSWEEDQFGVTAGIYYVTATDENYCHYTLAYEVTEPDPYLIQVTDHPTLCYGQTGTIGISVSGNTPPYTVLWSNGDNGLTTNVNPLHDTTYTAMVIDSNSCVSPPIEVPVSVHEELNMTVEADADMICPGDSVRVNVDITGGGISGEYVIINDSIYQLPVYLTADETTEFTFVVYDDCMFDSIKYFYTLETYELPPVNISADKLNGCAPLTVQFFEHSPDIGQRYIWNFDDGDFENLSFDKNPVHTFRNSTTYYVKLETESVDGCRNEDIIPIVVFPVPRADFRASSTNIHMASPNVSFTNFTVGGFYYTWDFGDGAGTNVESPQHNYSFPGTYNVVLATESLYGCVDTASVEINVSGEMLIYAPTAFSPNHDVINENFIIIGDGIDIETFKMEIYNRWGESIYVTEDFEYGWDGTSKNKECPEGVYSWIATFEDLYGNPYTMTGQVTLIK
ncbi:MAG: PKD domain-containing protein [Bacteroidales bacterium]|nr:PKD domain-containing protein [Bacteroidales bacterium]